MTVPRALPSALVHALGPLRAAPETTALLFDFDGTLAPVVDDPAAAAASPTTRARLAELARRYALVGVVSGRPISFLAAQVPAEVALSGLYGLEARVDGAPVVHPEMARWEATVAEAAADLAVEAAPGAPLHGAVVEPKGASITLHWRTRPELEERVLDAARRSAQRHELEARPAKMSVELHPPVAVDKGTASLELLGGRRRALFVGDDVGDLPALAALRAAADRGALEHLVTVAVGGPEAPPALREAASHVLGAQADVDDLLGALLA